MSVLPWPLEAGADVFLSGLALGSAFCLFALGFMLPAFCIWRIVCWADDRRRRP